jgi:hypothetical protein
MIAGRIRAQIPQYREYYGRQGTIHKIYQWIAKLGKVRFIEHQLTIILRISLWEPKELHILSLSSL